MEYTRYQSRVILRCFICAVFLVLAACEPDVPDIEEHQTRHCSSATYWFSGFDGKVTILDTKSWMQSDQRTVSITYDLKSRDSSPYKGRTMRLMFHCRYIAHGPPEQVGRAIRMEAGGRKLSEETLSALNVRIGLLGLQGRR